MWKEDRPAKEILKIVSLTDTTLKYGHTKTGIIVPVFLVFSIVLRAVKLANEKRVLHHVTKTSQ